MRRRRIVVVAQPAPASGWRDLPPAGRDLDVDRWLIKRVTALAGDPMPAGVPGHGQVPDGHVIVLGDDPRSYDSRQHGPCPVAQIVGVVVRRLAGRQSATT